ncbi:hypothetical protein [Polaribacter sp. Q13]|uniref:hypothetical protein n=1 Tax=Polaribacter sp. Q13 TaxID=2806551 RepID=UPI00193B5785|nr:hypothetical protein [Polaribacter sp. Q13]QVY67111.1 hypothetical protein JOP69_07515 [Polaribacter sp. Q13]
MTKKEALVKYISEMNIDMLSLVLENDTSIMNITKDLFLEKLEEIFTELKAVNINEFSKVKKGVSEDDSETNGLEGYQFITADKSALTFLFEEENEDLIDIYNCYEFKPDKEETTPILFCIWNDEELSYSPTDEYISFTTRIDAFYAQFEALKNTIIPLEIYGDWFKLVKELYDCIPLRKYLEYKFYYDFSNFVVDNLFVLTIIEDAERTQKAVSDYKKIDISNEIDILEWQLKYKDIRYVFNDYSKKLDNFKERYLIKHKTEDSIILDCSKYKFSFEFAEIRSQ